MLGEKMRRSEKRKGAGQEPGRCKGVSRGGKEEKKKGKKKARK